MSSRAGTPRSIATILAWPWLWPACRVALVSAFAIGGLAKLSDFAGAIAEQEHFGLRPGWLWAALAIAVEIGGSALVIAERRVWLGAGGLGVLTAVAMLTANNFWALSGDARFMALNAFFEHLGLIAGLVLVSVHATERAKTKLSLASPPLERKRWSLRNVSPLRPLYSRWLRQ